MNVPPKAREAAEAYTAEMDRRGELLPGAADLLVKGCLGVGQPRTPGEAVGWIERHLSGQGAGLRNPAYRPAEDETALMAVCRRLPGISGEHAARELHDQIAAGVAGMPIADAARVAADLLGHPKNARLTSSGAAPPLGLDRVLAVLEALISAGAVPRGTDVERLVREHAALGARPPRVTANLLALKLAEGRLGSCPAVRVTGAELEGICRASESASAASADPSTRAAAALVVDGGGLAVAPSIRREPAETPGSDLGVPITI